MATLPPLTPDEIAADRGPRIIAGNLVVAIIATIAVGLRFLARTVKSGTYGVDDWLILAALPFGWGMAIATIISVQHGLGRHLIVMEELYPEKLITEGKAYYASELIWTISIPLIKISILLLYTRIFGHHMRVFRYTVYGLCAFTIAWAIMVIFVIIFQCNPVSKAWNPLTPGTCINSWLFFVIGSSMNCGTDIAILILPLPSVLRLQLSKWQKISLVGVFLLGSLSCVFGLVRLSYMISEKNNLDPTWALAGVAIWSTAEPCLGITAACLPTLRPLFSSAFSSITTKSKRYDTHESSYAIDGPGISNRLYGHSRTDRQFEQLPDSAGDTDVEVFVGTNPRSRALPLNGINVQTSTSWKIADKK